MTYNTNKKKLIRNRMKATGESYLLAARKLALLNQPLPTPWLELNTLLKGGLRGGGLYTVASYPAVGKSLVGMELASSVGSHALVFSLEMKRDEYFQRFTAMEEPLSRVTFFDDIYELETLIEISRIACDNKEISLIVVDYLQLLNIKTPNLTHQTYLGNITRELAKLSFELKVPIVVLSQLNCTPEGVPIGLSNLRDSGSLEQDSQAVVLLERDSTELKFTLMKNRVGATGEFKKTLLNEYPFFSIQS